MLGLTTNFNMETKLDNATEPQHDAKLPVMWRCLDDFVMQNGDKETAFIKDKEYKQVGTFEGGIELINEQGYGHKIYGSCLKFFNTT